MVATHASADWYRSAFGLIQGTNQTVILNVLNTGQTSVTIQGASGNDSQLQVVTGATTNDPPWSPPFTPLSFVLVYGAWDYDTHQVHPGWRSYGIVVWNHESGFESWNFSGGELEPSHRRDRVWYSSPGWIWINGPYSPPE